MIVDLRIEPLCKKEGALCEMCRERVLYPVTLCVCGEEVVWIDRHGHKIANLPPRTDTMIYVFSVLGIKYFQTEAERDLWEDLEREKGGEIIVAWANWLKETSGRKIGRRGLKSIWTCVTEIGEPHDRLGASKRTLGVATQDELRREVAREKRLQDL